MASTSSVVADIASWAKRMGATALPPDLVPGTDASERSALAALGGLAAALADEQTVETWPLTLQWWSSRSPRPPDQLTERVAEELRNGDADVLALAYEDIVSGPNRRRLGTFFTPEPVVELMLDRAEELLGVPDHVIDPGAGVGAFSAAARARWANGSTTVTAVDVNVVTLGLLAARCAAMSLSDVELVLDDYLSWIASRQRGTGRTLIMGNPPYTRHQELSSKQKAAAQVAAGRLVDSGLAGLSAYFLAASIAALGDQDALCFLLPGSWTEARYGRPLRDAIWTATNRRVELHGFPASAEVFPGTKVTAMVVAVGPSDRRKQRLTTHVAAIEKASATTSDGTARPRTGESAPAFGNWLWAHRSSSKTKTVELGELARVRRGVATGANHFFFLDDSSAELLPTGALRPALRRLRHVQGDVLDADTHAAIGEAGLPRWLLALWDEESMEDAAVAALISRGQEQGVHLGYLTSIRSRWFVVEQVDPPHALVALASQGRLRVVHNEVGAVPSNSMYGVYLDDPDLGGRVVAWLNGPAGQRAMRSVCRHYSHGLMKLEPRDLLRVRVDERLLRDAVDR